jgi:hypothetical protein
MAIDARGVCPLLQVYDMATSVKFYRDMLGFEVVTKSPVLGPDRFHWVLLRRMNSTMSVRCRRIGRGWLRMGTLGCSSDVQMWMGLMRSYATKAWR